jgi:hypothetical protein
MLLHFKMCARFTSITTQLQTMEASNEAKMYLFLPTLILVFNLGCRSENVQFETPPPPMLRKFGFSITLAKLAFKKSFKLKL